MSFFLPSQINTTMQLQPHFLYIRKPTLVSHIRYLTNQIYYFSFFLFLENILKKKKDYKELK